MLQTIQNGDGIVTVVDAGDADDLVLPADGSATGTGSGGTTGPTGNAPPAAEAVTLAGSGLVFNNTYGAGVTATFRNEIVAAENYLQSQFTNSCTINCSFDLQNLAQGISGQNSFDALEVSYATYVNALASHATSTAQRAAVASLQQLADPSHGGTFLIPLGEARILGLAGSPSAGTIDDTVVLNSFYWTSAALQNNPTDAEGVLEHELTEGGMGRIGSLGIAATGFWAPMDLFRFTASGQRDFTGGRDGQATYFSVDGSSVNTGLRYHASVNASGQFDGADFADWDQVAQDANAHDPFGPGGPGAGDPGTLSATDLQIMNVLGWSADGIAVTGTKQDALQGGATVTLLTAAPIITDGRSTTLVGATIRVANGSGASVAGDKLFVAGIQSGTVSGLTVAWNATTNTLTLSGTASIATYQTVLSQVTYQDTGTDGSSGGHPVRTVTWSVNDGTQMLSTTSQVTVDRPPTVTNETGFAVAGTTLTVASANGALAGDSDLDLDALAVTTVNGVAVAAGGTTVAGSFGRLTLNPNGSYSYAANAGVAAGSQDSFNVTVGDGNGGSGSATLRVTVDNALVTAPLAILTPSGKATPSTWTLTGSGGNGSLTFSLGSAASHGTAVVNPNGTFTYTPGAGYSGADSFQYRVTDGLGETNLNTVSVGVGNSGYSIAQSLQLSGAQQQLRLTPSVVGDQKTWTWSAWVDAANVSGTLGLFMVSTGNQLEALRLNGNALEFYEYDYTTATSRTYVQTSTTISPNTWHEVELAYDTTQATAANRVRIYVDGQQLAFSTSTQTDPAQNSPGLMGGTAPQYIGQEQNTHYFIGNLADVQFIDGQALAPSALGTLVNGVWQPVAYTGSYGTNGYHLTFAAGAIGTDVSGNGNNFTPVNIGNANVSSATPGGSGLGVALTLDNGLSFNGGSSDAISGATVRLTGGFANDGDLLFANTSGTAITTNWNAASETLTLSGTDTAAHYQSVLNNLVFSSSATDPTNGGSNTTRTATWQVTDATNNQLSAPQSETIDISPVFAAGALPPAATPSLNVLGAEINSFATDLSQANLLYSTSDEKLKPSDPSFSNFSLLSGSGAIHN